jgi:hypothetical protein
LANLADPAALLLWAAFDFNPSIVALVAPGT